MPREQPGGDVPGSGAVVGTGLVPGKGSQRSAGASLLPEPSSLSAVTSRLVPFSSCCPNLPLAEPSLLLGKELIAPKKMKGYKHLER